MTAPLFYVDRVATARVVLTGDDARHAGVLRLRGGEPVLVSDGKGRLGHGAVAAISPRRLEIEVDQVSAVPEPPVVRVVQGLPKGERGDLAVELLTETGASEIVPWQSQRTVADWRGKEQTKLQRWQRVARAAGMQSRRAYLPRILPLCTGLPDLVGQTFVLHEEADTDLFSVDPAAGPITVVVGPEGGLTDHEAAAMQDAGARIVGLGAAIMRTSTAGAAACVWIRGFEMRARA